MVVQTGTRLRVSEYQGSSMSYRVNTGCKASISVREVLHFELKGQSSLFVVAQVSCRVWRNERMCGSETKHGTRPEPDLQPGGQGELLIIRIIILQLHGSQSCTVSASDFLISHPDSSHISSPQLMTLT